MKDRFKYRVWNNKKRKYEEDELDYFICCTPGVVYESHCCVFDDLKEAEEGHYILEQCTGLKDKNGKLIYEGDIVSKEFTDRPFSSKAKSKTKNCLIYWSNSRGAFSLKYKIDNYGYYSVYHNNYFGDCEIIGNIHENPELLED